MSNQSCEKILTNTKFWYTILALTTTFILGYLSYLTIGILVLVYDYDIWIDCKKSSVWIYTLITLIISILQLIFLCIKKNKLNNKNILTLLVYESILVIFGFISLFVNICNELKKSNLWTFSLITLLLQCLVTIFLGIYFIKFYRKQQSRLHPVTPNISLDILQMTDV